MTGIVDLALADPDLATPSLITPSAEANNFARVQLERKYAEEALEKANQELAAKQERIVALFAEVCFSESHFSSPSGREARA